MISRRRLIGSTVALSALGLGSRAAIVAANAPALQYPRPALVLIDTRFDDVPAIARRLATPGVRRLAMPRDVLDLWHGKRQAQSLADVGCFAGVTTERGFFLLRTLAADHRLRVLSATFHEAAPGAPRTEPLVSWIIGPAAANG